MEKLQIKKIRTLSKGRVELTFYEGKVRKNHHPKKQKSNSVVTKNRGYKKDAWIDAKTLRPL